MMWMGEKKILTGKIHIMAKNTIIPNFENYEIKWENYISRGNWKRILQFESLNNKEIRDDYSINVESE